MNIILRLKNAYFKKRKKHCFQKYKKYLLLLKNNRLSYLFTSQSIESQLDNETRYSLLCKKYKEKCYFYTEKLNKIQFY